MHGFLKMLLGKGEQENQALHREFRDAIPERFPPDMPEEERAAKHPACSGPFKNTMVAADYRRANQMRGPLSKQEERLFISLRKMQDAYQKEVDSLPSGAVVVSFNEWLAERLR